MKFLSRELHLALLFIYNFHLFQSLALNNDDNSVKTFGPSEEKTHETTVSSRRYSTTGAEMPNAHSQKTVSFVNTPVAEICKPTESPLMFSSVTIPPSILRPTTVFPSLESSVDETVLTMFPTDEKPTRYPTGSAPFDAGIIAHEPGSPSSIIIPTTFPTDQQPTSYPTASVLLNIIGHEFGPTSDTVVTLHPSIKMTYDIPTPQTSIIGQLTAVSSISPIQNGQPLEDPVFPQDSIPFP